jgi:hypothetical protein
LEAAYIMQVREITLLALILLILFVGVISLSLSPHTSVLRAQMIERPKVTITNPDADQEVPVGNLTIYGTSSDDALRSCKILILLNDDKPYQDASARGPEGRDDYSKWTFTFDLYSSLIKHGQNEIVSKIVCIQQGVTNSNNPSVSHNKINVTGSREMYQQTDSSITLGKSQIQPPDLVKMPTNTPAYEEEPTHRNITKMNTTTVTSPSANTINISDVVPSVRTDNDNELADPAISNSTHFNKTKSPPPSVINTHQDQRTVAIDNRGNTNATLAIVSNSTGEGLKPLRESLNRTLEALYNKDLVAALQSLNEADSQLFKIIRDLRSKGS